MTDPTDDPLEGFRSSGDPRDPRATSLLRSIELAAEARWALIGLPYDGGIPGRPGARFGPGALRGALAGFSAHDGDALLPPLVDFGDLALGGSTGHHVHRRIEEAATRIFAGPHRPLFIGGDHGCTGSIIRGLAAARPSARLAVINIDAHLDVREYEDDSALSSGTPFRRALETGILSGDRVTMIGLRPFANSGYYLDWATERGVGMFTAEDVAEHGPDTVARLALDAIGDDVDSVYLSIDLDAADAAFAPGVSAPGVGGLTSREMIALVSRISSDRRLVGADLMELSPPYDTDGRTARLAARLLLEILRRTSSHSTAA